ncbi:regulatory protein RecX [Leucobacter triazinivorans]|uniref:Regulatory protein RecX n=1 Tax=Leucobacter triazinivorans TaxID=1784719 RepID=A0A4P6KCM2_9MICO|nr:regulatory protein RecX [Leucobacter triazinivorans]QBE47873.1 RecX family transcriptional regulator [Leucobacter triazinivorans]
MAVRFLPDPGERAAETAQDRGDLAEVIELRAMLQRRTSSARPHGVGDVDAAGELAGSSSGAGGGDRSGAIVAPQPTVPAERGEVLQRASAVSPQGVDDAPDEPDDRSASEDGVRILARRARSSGELREELLRLEHDPHEVELVIDEFETSHYLDDAGLARLLTEKLRDTKRASRSQIRLKLRARKLPDEVIEAALGELDTDEEFTILRETAQDRARKLAGLERQTAERRLLGFLARRGWSGEPAMRAAREALDGASRGNGSSSGVRFS